MSEFERFSQHWQNAVNGLVGRMVNSEKAVFTQREINEMWQEELMDNRFSSIRSEAGEFLTDLRQRDYDTARRVEDMLWNSRLDVGMAPELCAAKAIGAAAALSLSVGGDTAISCGGCCPARQAWSWPAPQPVTWRLRQKTS